MARLCQTDGLTDDQTEILGAVRTFVDEKILPVATELEHADEYPTEIVEGLKELGMFGLMIPEEYDGLGESLLTYALCVEEIARGWMSVSGVINTHFIVAYMLMKHGTEEQRKAYLPRMAAGEVRGAFSMSEPGLGSDVAAVKTKATQTESGYEITGQKMWLTNGGSSNLVAVLCKTDEGADSVYKNLTTFLVEKEPGFGEVTQGITVPGKIDKMGYKGIDTTEMVFESHRISADQVLGDKPGQGFYQMMDGVEDDGHRAGLRVGHQTTRTEHPAEPADLAHQIRRGNHRVEVQVALGDLLDQLVGADLVGARRLGRRRAVTGGEDEDPCRLAGAVGQIDRAADHLVRLAGVDAEAYGDVDRLVELGDGVRLGERDGLVRGVELRRVDLLDDGVVRLAALHVLVLSPVVV